MRLITIPRVIYRVMAQVITPRHGARSKAIQTRRVTKKTCDKPPAPDQEKAR